MTNEIITSRIRKLLAKAGDPAVTQQESEALTEKAYELMVKHAIDEAMLTASKADREKIVKRLALIDFVPAAYQFEYGGMLVNLAQFFNSRAFVILKSNPYRVIIVGHEADLDALQMMYQSLTIQCMASMRAWLSDFETKKQLFGIKASEKMNIKKSFVLGFANGVVAKFVKIRQSAISESGHSAELVLVDRSQKVDDWVSLNMEITNKRIRRSYSTIGESQGYKEGQRADIGQSSMGHDRRGITS